MLYFAPWKVALVAVLCLLGLAFTIPNFLSEQTVEGLPGWLPHKQVNLGLDLQGGSHLLLEVEADVVVQERLAALVDSVRPALRGKRIGYRDLGERNNAVIVTIRKPEQLDLAIEEIRKLAVPVQGNVVTGITGGRDIVVEVVNGNQITVTLTEEAIRERRRSAVEQSIEIVRRRIDELGTREPTIQRQGDERILVQVPGLQDPERLKSILGKTAKMVFRLVDVTVSPAEILAGARTPPGSELLESDERNPDGSAVNMYVVRKRVMVSGDTLVDSSATFQDNMPVVSFRFDSVGAKRFGDATAKNVRKPFAIVLDRRVISAPVIREPILGGSGIISGNFTVQEVQDLSLLLRAGALPAPLKILEERTVGPALGADSVAAGKVACVIAFVAVMVFMVLSYGIFGLAADLALLVNLFLIMGALSLLQATLTLPGIAGIVLTIGMAVDANVLVFERIREEVRTGKTPFAAMEAGYQRALGTILDANITTFIAAVILFVMGSGPIKGFSVTLGIGIITSVFTRRDRDPIDAGDLVAPIPARGFADLGAFEMFLIKLVPTKTSVPFIRWHKPAMAVSTLLVFLSAIMAFTPGLNFGIDFRGGILIEVQTEGPANLSDMRSNLGNLGLGEVTLQEFGAADTVLIRVEKQSGDATAQQKAVAKVRGALGNGLDYRRTEFVGPKVSGELIEAGAIAIALSVVLMLIYIWFRFEWHFGVGAVVALIHDVALSIGMFAVTQMEFNLSTIAALLTIVGYSINDTVVVYDRVRENLRKYKTMDLPSVLNLAINNTLSRTTMTSVTTLLALVVLFVFGGAVIQGFVFAMMWGVVVGTYSSIFIAAPLLIVLGLGDRHRSGQGVNQDRGKAKTSS